MDARITFVTLAVRDIAATRRFYVDGLGWQPAFEEAPGEVIFVRVGAAVMLSLWDRAAFEAEVGAAAAGPGIPPITLAHNMPDVDGVDAVMADAAAAGGEIGSRRPPLRDSISAPRQQSAAAVSVHGCCFAVTSRRAPTPGVTRLARRGGVP